MAASPQMMLRLHWLPISMLDVDHGLSDLQIHLIDITKDGIIEADDATMILKYYVMTLTSGSADWDNLP